MMTVHKHISNQNDVRNGRKANEMGGRRKGNNLNKKRSCQLQQNLTAAVLEKRKVSLFTCNGAGTSPTRKSSAVPPELLFPYKGDLRLSSANDLKKVKLV